MAQELLLLALHDEKGSVRWVATSRLPYCLAGALLMELSLMKRLRITTTGPEVLDRTPTGQPLLDETLRMIDSAQKVKAPYYWVSKLGRRIKSTKSNLLKGLVDQGILNREEHRILGIFPTTRYPSRDDRSRKDITSRVCAVVLRREHPDPRTTMLISLVYTCALTNSIFDKDERRDARQRLKEIAKPLPITQAIKKAIQRAQ